MENFVRYIYTPLASGANPATGVSTLLVPALIALAVLVLVGVVGFVLNKKRK